MKSFINVKELFCFSKFNLTFVTPDYFWDTTSVSKEEEKFKEFRGFLEKSVFNSLFSDYEITEKFYCQHDI